MLMAVTPAFASRSASFGLASVPSVPISTVPGFRKVISSSVGRPTRSTMSAWPYRAGASGTMVAPASRKASSGR